MGARLDKTQNRNATLDFIRQHGNYLIPGKGVTGASLLAVTFRAIFVSLYVYFSLLTAIMVLFFAWGLFSADSLPAGAVSLGFTNKFLFGAAMLGMGLILGSLLYSILTLISQRFLKRRYSWRTRFQIGFGWVLAIAVVFLVLGLLPFVHGLVHDYIAGLGAGASTIIGAIIGFLKTKQSQNPERPEKKESPLESMRLVAGAFLLIFGLTLAAYVLASKLSALHWTWALDLAIPALIVGFVVNTNYLGLHRVYRDRLMETFLPNLRNVRSNRWGLATQSDDALIENMCQSPNRRPYHLINTNVVLVDSPEAKYRGRGGDSFVLSPLYCGSDATGWRKSADYMKSTGRGMTLPTAMAISAAAANPNSGAAGKGPTVNRLVSILMSLLNIRLGYWAPHPDPQKSWPFAPNFIYPGLKGGILPGGLSEERRMIELTDGGHFENLALYELIRRRARVIIVSDGGADPKFRFEDLGNATERVRVDFGAKISFDDPEYDLRSLLPRSADEESVLHKRKYKLAKRGFAIGTIRYADNKDQAAKGDLVNPKPTPLTEGTLIYFKTTMIPGLPTDIYSYKSANPSFPDQSTADQFFDETQFEAYRELGYQIGKRMLAEAKALKEKVGEEKKRTMEEEKEMTQEEKENQELRDKYKYLFELITNSGNSGLTGKIR